MGPTSVHETNSSGNAVFSDDFDFLVVASGYFARPYIPEIPGLAQFKGQLVHSSALQKGNYSLVRPANEPNPGNVVVIGGSMSGVEAASALALNESSSIFNTVPRPRDRTRQAVYHIYSRPFWSLPTYLPRETSDDAVSLLPLDLAMYDLGRRPPGPIEYALGPVPEDKAAKTNNYFNALLGTEYAQFGFMNGANAAQKTTPRPSWVAIGNDYAEFVRSGAIESTMGRATSVQPNQNTRLASIKIETVHGQSMILENISSIVLATGFTPFDSLSFLPADVLSALEYSTEDPFLPLVLDNGGTFRSEMPDIGFVGFYRGPYWGIMEMQSRFLGEAWNGQTDQTFRSERQREGLRILRQPDSEICRGQFPMGDYVGLMEFFSADMGIPRTALSNGDSRSGPVVPARYVHGADSAGDSEVRRTLNSLQIVSNPNHDAAQAAAALAIFRALHGSWQFIRSTAATGVAEASGTAVFHPRYPSDLKYDREYVVEENVEPTCVQDGPISERTAQSMFRLSDAGAGGASSRIELWTVGPKASANSGPVVCFLKLSPFCRKKKDGEYLPGEYVVNAESVHLTDANGLTDASASGQREYTFHFKGVSISSWECVFHGNGFAEGKSPAEDRCTDSRTVYERTSPSMPQARHQVCNMSL